MAVGSKLGQVYNNDQGKGLAVVLDTAGYWRQRELAQRQSAAAEAAKRKAKADALAKLEDNRPDVKWPEYLNQIRGGYNELYEVAAKHITDTGADPLTSADSTSRAIRAKMNDLDLATQRVNVLKGEHDKRMEDIGTRGDKYTQESVDEILNFTNTYSVQDMARGYRVVEGSDGKVSKEWVNMPELVFKNPSTLFNDYYINGSKHLKTEYASDTGFVDPMKVRSHGIDYFTAEENEHNLRAANQMYQKLKPDSEYAKAVRSYASQMGMADMPGMALAIMNMERTLDPNTVNVAEVTRGIAKAAPVRTIGYQGEDPITGKVVTTERDALTDNAYAKREADSWLTTNRWVLNRPDVLSQLGIDRSTSGSDEETYQAVRDAVEKNITDQIVLNRSDSTRYETQGGRGSSKLKQNFDDEWLARIKHPKPEYNTEAVKWLVGLTLPGTEGAITAAHVLPIDSELGQSATGATKVVRILFEDQKSANAARAKARAAAANAKPPKDFTGMPIEGEALEQWKEQSALYMKELYTQAGGNAVIIPVNEDFHQVLKNIHGEQVKATGALYESAYPRLDSDKFGVRAATNSGAMDLDN